ncbi:hypothetical protein Glove_84g32 [Diversispora epigaea]|uniref:Protein kinase domain-containing protein n=1 Tax=Diversispora epigaea TaxID=1348612 RepID=A0A397JGW8_9GLOM|nr:hypothetical protein Glove_84g32 [Diversispora epigaea]
MPCPECNQKWNEYSLWCKPCNSKNFQNDFNNWTSGNDKIDKFIQDAQLNANNYLSVIEWISYDRFKDFKQIGKGGFGTIHYARYQGVDGVGIKVALKKFENFLNFNDVLNEMEIHFKICTGSDGFNSIQFYGITQDQTHSYMMVLEYASDGNLREYLKNNLYNLSLRANPNNPEKKNIFGVLPYIAPEVLSGDEEYTKAADVYSYGIIAYEIVTGFPPYPDIPHEEDLAMKICSGLRPKIPFHTPKLITRIIMRCWDARVTHRPTFKELCDELYEYWDNYDYYLREEKNKDSEIGIQIKKAEEFSVNQESTNTTTTTTPLNYQTHPQAIYTSRLLNYSKLPKPKNEENFERELEELTKSFSHITTNDDIDEF